ncbi:MAG TPA: hypothetical protein VL463_07085 [Kofleriaceae bacterium]|nr:hypothetical protein [Kofleriaceae bacterium]
MKLRTLAIALLAAAACRGSSSNNPDGNNNNPDGVVNPDDVTIYDIQDPSNKVQVGATVTVRGVVVTAIDNFGDKTGNIWVEEPGGGAYSGVEVFNAGATQVAALAVGDLVDITGAEKAEFALSTDTSGRTTTELEPPNGGMMTVTKVGTGTVPDPVTVDPLAIAQLDANAQDAEWEKTEGVLIKVNAVGVISSTKQIAGANPDPTFQSFVVTGPLTVESSFAAFPTTGSPAVGPQFGDCEMSITGIGDYFFQWNLLPRATAEISTGGSGCPVSETGDAACGDGKDNDGNGHADCGDYSCDLSVASCVKGATVNDVDTSAANAPVGGAVNVDGVFVVAVDSANKNLWVADALAAATDHGVYVFRGTGTSTTTLDAGVLPGAKVNVDLAAVSPFHGLMELAKIPGAQSASPAISVVAAPAGQPTALSTTLATLADTTMIAHYAGSLVTLSNVKVTATSGTGTKTIYTISDGTKTMEMGVQINDPKPVVGTTCYKTLTGIATLDTSPNPSVPMILPLTGGALPGGTCN